MQQNEYKLLGEFLIGVEILAGIILPIALMMQKAIRKNRKGFGIALMLISILCSLGWSFLGIIISWSSFGIMCGFKKREK